MASHSLMQLSMPWALTRWKVYRKQNSFQLQSLPCIRHRHVKNNKWYEVVSDKLLYSKFSEGRTASHPSLYSVPMHTWCPTNIHQVNEWCAKEGTQEKELKEPGHWASYRRWTILQEAGLCKVVIGNGNALRKRYTISLFIVLLYIPTNWLISRDHLTQINKNIICWPLRACDGFPSRTWFYIISNHRERDGLCELQGGILKT